jgi:hypothetical protein
MDFTALIFAKLMVPQYIFVEIFCTELNPVWIKNVQNMDKSQVHCEVKYGFHCPNFYETCCSWTALHENSMY